MPGVAIPRAPPGPLHAIANSAGFRRAIDQIEEVRAERLYAVLYEAALNGDTKAAQFLLARHDRMNDRQKSRRDLSF